MENLIDDSRVSSSSNPVSDEQSVSIGITTNEQVLSNTSKVETKPSYKLITPQEVVENVTQNIPEAERSETQRLQESLVDPWAPQKVRYEVAGWLAKSLVWIFALLIIWSGIVMTLLLVVSIFRDTQVIQGEQIQLISNFFKDILPFVATPLGVALGFYFRQSDEE